MSDTHVPAVRITPEELRKAVTVDSPDYQMSVMLLALAHILERLEQLERDITVCQHGV